MKGIIIAIVVSVIGALVALLIMSSTYGEFLYLWGLVVGVITTKILKINERNED